MKKKYPLPILIASLLFVSFSTMGQSDSVLLRETGDTIDSLPEMVIVPDTSQVYAKVRRAIDHSFMGTSIRLYHIAQRYLYNQGKVDELEPAYLALTSHQGGFAKTGFVLSTPETKQRKPRAHYVDLTEGNLHARLGRLQSLTQLYPHELTHVIYKMLCADTARKAASFNINMHYFSVTTDYGTAFNEGLAEHMENISRMNETNDTITKGIQDQVQTREGYPKSRSDGFVRDMQWPMRTNYYKASMLVWYSQFEDYKRYRFALGDEETFVRPASAGSAQDAITLRNSGVQNPKIVKKNIAQLASSEGFVSTFLTQLAGTDLSTRYQPASFYRPFIDDSAQVNAPEQLFTPVENLFVKYFYVLHRFVHYEDSERAQLIDFIEGYIDTFPDEAPILLEVYERLAGVKYAPELPVSLWFLVKGYQHSAIVIDPFGGIPLPIYTFEINRAEAEDLLTIPGMTREAADSVIDWRNKHGFFQSYDQLFTSTSLTPPTRERLRAHVMDKAYFDSLSEENLSMITILVAPVKHLLAKVCLYFLPILVLVFLTQPKEKSWMNLVLNTLKYFGWWFVFALGGLMAVVINGNAISLFLAIAGVPLILIAFIMRKSPAMRNRHLLLFTVMILLILYSIW